MNVTRGPQLRRINRATLLTFPRLAFAALVQFSHRIHRLLLPGEFDQRIVLAGHMQHRLGFEPGKQPRRCGTGRGEGGESLTTRRPEQIGEAAAVGVAGCVNAFVVHSGFPLETRQHGVKEFQVAIALVADA